MKTGVLQIVENKENCYPALDGMNKDDHLTIIKLEFSRTPELNQGED
jgi:hypothetical protein